MTKRRPDDLLREVVDRQQLNELYASYCFGLDYDDDQRVLDCFTPDGVFVMSDHVFTGHGEIQRILDASAATTW